MVQELPLQGKMFLITGATDGIGQFTAREVARRGGNVLLHGRTKAKAEAAAEAVRSVAQGRATVEPVAGNLASLAETRRLAEEVKRAHPKLDVLVNNAGIFAGNRRELSEDGYEMTWAVNVLAPFLLGVLLQDAVTGRIVNVSSISAGRDLDWGNLNQERRYSAHDAYSTSKLAMMLITAEQAQRLGSSGPTSNCLDPGTVNTKLLDAGWGPCGIDIEDADDELWLASAPELERVSGQYYVGKRKRSMPAIVRDGAARRRLWELLSHASSHARLSDTCATALRGGIFQPDGHGVIAGDCGVSLRRGRRGQMEDRATCVPYLLGQPSMPMGYYAVFDGHEGAAAAEYASTHLHCLLASRLRSHPRWPDVDRSDVEAALRGAVAEADAALLAAARSADPENPLPDGTTAAWALLQGRDLLAAWLGDSSAVLCRWAGSAPEGGQLAAVALTTDHSPGRPDERARILAAGGTVTTSPDGSRARLDGELAVSRALGDAPYRSRGLIAEPELAPWQTLDAADALLLLASDGVFETLPAEAACQIALAVATGADDLPPTPLVVRPSGNGHTYELTELLAQLPRVRARPGLALHHPALARPLPLPAAGVWGGYERGCQFARGSFGEGFVLKRILGGRGSEAWRSGRREEHFGRLLWPAQARAAAGGGGDGAEHIVRFVESLETGGSLWLVFRDEGLSLHALMYSPAAPRDASGGGTGRTRRGGSTGGGGGAATSAILHPSEWWWQLRQGPGGEETLRSLLKQTLAALAALHAANVTHRDVKPENLLVRPGRGEGGLHLRLIDFGSALDAHAVRALYGVAGPSDAQQTREYAPPEALLGRYWQEGALGLKRTWPYDMWSLGVSWLEIMLATPHVFLASARTRARLFHQLRLGEQAQEDQALALWLRGLMELCLYPPARPPHPGGARTTADAGGEGAATADGEQGAHVLLPWACGDAAVGEQLRARDPAGRGLPSVPAVRLLRALLSWNPGARPTAEQALRHAYFMTPLAEQHGLSCAANRSLEGWC
ncbi:hypothetical protein WJX81_008695 [Elliptochloris bilobata]|uniref:Protein-serine/threonine phosphatase n=1 Tax=Elliptochloris bilobata TaxID=381761 RepID=A0AAW1R1V7_9CHLO